MSGDENPYWISFSDIMAGLVGHFYTGFYTPNSRVGRAERGYQTRYRADKTAHEIRAQMLLEIKEELAKERINVEISDNESVLHILDELAFAENKATIPKDKEIFVGKVGEAIFSALNAGKKDGICRHHIY